MWATFGNRYHPQVRAKFSGFTAGGEGEFYWTIGPQAAGEISRENPASRAHSLLLAREACFARGGASRAQRAAFSLCTSYIAARHKRRPPLLYANTRSASSSSLQFSPCSAKSAA